MKTLKIYDIIQSNSANLDEKGSTVFEVVKKYVEKNEPVILDFTGIDTLITAFLNLAIGQLYDLKPADEITKLVKIKRSSLSDAHFEKVLLVLSNSTEKRQELSDIQEEVMQGGY